MSAVEVLPQAVAAREERPAAVRAASPMGPTAYGAPGPGLSVAHIVTTAFLRWPWLLLAFLLPVLAGLFLASRAGPSYTASAALAVLATRESTGTTDLSGFGTSVQSVELLKVVRTEAEIMESDDTARRALRRLGVESLFPNLGARRLFGLLPGRPEEDRMAQASEAFRRATRTATDSNSNILRVSFIHADRDTAIRALRALMDAYFEQRAALYRDGGSSLLGGEVTRYADELREIEETIERTKRDNRVLDIVQEITLAAGRLDTLRRRENELREQRATTGAQLAAAQAALGTQPARVFASSDSTNLQPNDDSRNTLLRLTQERERMAVQYAPDYPGLADLDRRIAAARAAVRETARTTFTTAREVRNPVVETLTGRVVTLQVDANAIRQQLAEVQEQRNQAEARADALLVAERSLRDLQRRRDGLEGIYRQLAQREAGARVEEDARRQRNTNLQVLQQPNAPLSPSRTPLLLAVAGVGAGLAAAAFATLLFSLLRTSFATPAEAERGLTLASLGSFGSLHRAAQELKDQEDVAEFASLLLDLRVDSPHTGRVARPQVIQFVATTPDDGRDLLARAVAVELGLRRDRATLLVDLQHDGRAHLNALGSQPMPVDRIEGHVIAFNTVIPQLWATYDARDSHLTDPRVAQVQTERLLDMLRREFDVVIIVGPDPSESYAMRRLTALVDANLMVVRGERTRGPEARELRDWILGAGGVLLGLAYTGRRQVMPAAVARLV